MSISPISAPAQTAALQQAQAARPRDADGDNDGTPAAAPKAAAPALANAGSVGTQLHEVA